MTTLPPKRSCPLVRPGPYATGRQLFVVAEAMAGRARAIAAQKVDSPAEGPAQSTMSPAQAEGRAMPEADQKSGTPALWYPDAIQIHPELPTVGAYAAGYPEGAVVQSTLGSYGLSELDLARQRGRAVMLLDAHGRVFQAHPLARWGRHGGGGASARLVGIALECAGPLAANAHGDFRTAWGAAVPRAGVRLVRAGQDNQVPGAYAAYTKAQEDGLVTLLLWLKSNNPAVFDLQQVFGHDELAPGRKVDPGGSLSLTMPALRRHLLVERLRREADGEAQPA